MLHPQKVLLFLFRILMLHLFIVKPSESFLFVFPFLPEVIGNYCQRKTSLPWPVVQGSREQMLGEIIVQVVAVVQQRKSWRKMSIFISIWFSGRRVFITLLLKLLSEAGELVVDFHVEVVVSCLVGHGLTQPGGNQSLGHGLLAYQAKKTAS